MANRSRDKCGDAFDYNIASPFVVAVREDVGGHIYFRSYLKAAIQDGTSFNIRIMASPLNGVGVPGASGGANNQDFALFVMNGSMQ